MAPNTDQETARAELLRLAEQLQADCQDPAWQTFASAVAEYLRAEQVETTRLRQLVRPPFAPSEKS